MKTKPEKIPKMKPLVGGAKAPRVVTPPVKKPKKQRE